MSTQREIKINHDGIIRLAAGRSRKDKNWINRELKWSELLDKLSQTVYTRESVEEYKSLPKSEQDGIKDVGGFVGGSLKGGRRKNDALEYRSLITLDADFAEGGLWEKIKSSSREYGFWRWGELSALKRSTVEHIKQYISKGEDLYLKGDLEREAIKRQEYHTETSINEVLIIKYLELLLPEEWERMNLYERRSYIHTEESKRTRVGVKWRTRVCAAEIWTEILKGELKDSASRVFIRDIHASLCRIEGWKPYGRGTGKLRFSFYGPQKAYIRLGGPEDR